MISNYHYIGNFHGERSTRIGSSDIPSLFPNPEKPTESLSGYGNTAITLYHKKTGESEPYTSSLTAEMGHFLENKALELFIRRFFSAEMASEFIEKKMMYEFNSGDLNPEEYQTGLFRHNTEFIKDNMIVHPDCIYLGDPTLLDAPKKDRYKTVEGVTVDKAKPFYIEAKSARQEATRRRDSLVKGYDFEATTWQGIPLKHFLQMQYQSVLMNIDVGYLPLLSNTSEFNVWRVDKNKKWQARIIDTVGKMLKHIEMRKPPKEMAICLDDIIKLYPGSRGDFKTVSGEESEKVKAIIAEYRKADRQEKNWKSVKKDCQDALSVHLQDYDSIMDGSDILMRWKDRKASEKITKLDTNNKDSLLLQIKKNDPNTYKYLLKKGYIQLSKASKSVDIKYKP